MDVWIVFGIYTLKLRMECFVAGAGEASIAFVHLYIWITFMEVDVVVVSR